MSSGLHKALCNYAANLLKKNGYSVVASELVSYAMEQPDVIGFKSSNSCLIEAKISRQDFFNDRKKWHRKELGMGNIRFFITPTGLVQESELPKGWGLIEVDEHLNHTFRVGIGFDIYQCFADGTKIELFQPDHKEEKAVLLSIIRRAKKTDIKNRNFIVHIGLDCT